MYGSLLTGRVMSDSGLLGAVQRDDPSRLLELLSGPSSKRGCQYEDLVKGIITASDKGFDQCVRILLTHHQRLQDIHDPNGFTPLHVAAKRGHANIVSLLVEARCNVNKATYRVRATALHWAATNGHEDCVDVLLEAGANVDLQTAHGRTALMLAARSGHKEIVRSLIEAGSQVTKCDLEKTTALHLAAEEDHADCIRLLLDSGADINAKMKKGDTPLLMAIKRGHDDVVELLLKLCPDINVTCSSNGLSALHWAAQGGRTSAFRLILPHYGSDVNLQTEETYYGPHFAVNAGVTPIMLAASAGYEDIVDMLLSKNAQVDVTDVEGASALLYAVKHEHVGCVTRLLAGGADPDLCQTDAPDSVDDPDLADGVDTDEEGQAGDNLRGDFNDHVQRVNDLDSNNNHFAMSPLFLSIERNSFDCFFALLQGGCSLTRVFMASNGRLLGPLEFALCKYRMAMAAVLLNTGQVFNLIMTPLVEQSLAVILQRDEDAFNQLMKLFSTPPLLSHQCRWTIRGRLPQNKIVAIDTLPVPEAIRRYLQLDDVRDIMYKEDFF